MEVKEQGYDEIPYDSFSFDYNRPENLKSCATLFGLETPLLENARILELGCAEGFNLYRFAETYPKSYTLGIDLSEVQIKNGQKIVKELGLKNIELKSMSITDLNESYGTFDYIICHGVFSWVPNFVQDGIIEISKKLLSKNGVAFISYNTLPGWNAESSVRELMLYHSENFTNTKDKIDQSKAILSFIQDSVKNSDTPYAKYLKNAVDSIADKSDSYIRHEYLAEENHSLYFHEFIDMARKQGLEYLCDANIAQMYVGNLPKQASDMLKQVQDPVRLAQYIDFITNGRFRCTLLCHQGTQFSRNIDSNIVKKFHYYCYIAPKTSVTEISISDNSNVHFEDYNGKTMSSSDPAVKAILMALCQNKGNPLSVLEIVKEAKKLAPQISKEVIEAQINAHFPKLILSDMLKFIVDKPKTIYKISAKPKVSKFNLLQINLKGLKGNAVTTNALNSIMLCNQEQISIVKMLDGTRTVECIKNETVENFKNNILYAHKNGKKIDDPARLKQISDLLVDQTLEHLRQNFLLVA